MSEQLHPQEFAEIVTRLTSEQKEAFFNNLRTALSENDYEETVKFLSLYELMTRPEKYRAVQKAMGTKIYEKMRK